MAFSAPDTDISPLKHGFSVPESDLPNGGFHAPQSDLWNIDPGTKLGIPTEFSGGEENKFSPDNPDAAFTRATEADPTGALAGLAVGAIQNGLIEPAAAKLMNLAMANLPAQPGEDSVAPAMPPIQPGVPLIPPPDGKGVLPALGRFASNFTTPGQLLTLPLAPESDLIKGFFATGAAAGIQPALEKFEQSQTPEDRNDAATELGLNVGMAALLGHGLGREYAAPGEQAIADQGAQTPPAAETPPGSSQAPPQSSSKDNPSDNIILSPDQVAAGGRAVIQAVADRYGLDWDAAVKVVSANRERLGMIQDVAPGEQDIADQGAQSINQAAESAFSPPNEVKAAEMAAANPPGEAVQPPAAPPGVQTPPNSPTATVPSDETLGNLTGKLATWQGKIGYVELDEDGRPVLWHSGKLYELPANADGKASDIGLEIFKKERRLPQPETSTGPATPETPKPPEPATPPQPTVDPVELKANLDLLNSVVGDMREKIRASGFQPDPTALDQINAVTKTATDKNADISQLYGALEATPIVKRQLSGIIGRLEAEGRHDETAPFYKQLLAVERFENQYQDVVTSPGKPARGKAKTADILPSEQAPSISDKETEPTVTPGEKPPFSPSSRVNPATMDAYPTVFTTEANEAVKEVENPTSQRQPTGKPLKNQGTQKPVAPVRQSAQEFDALVRDHAETQKWASGGTLEALHTQDPGKTNLGTVGIQGAIARNKAMAAARRNAAKQLGLDPEQIGSESYRAQHVGKLRELVGQEQAFTKATEDTGDESGKIGIQAGDLKPGDTLTVAGEPVKVVSVHARHVVLEDGRKFGRQQVDNEKGLYVEGYDEAPSKAATLPLNEKSRSPSAPVVTGPPKLGQGAKQGDLLASTQREDFNLAGEKGTDTERLAEAKRKAEATAAAAKEFEAKHQTELPGTETPISRGPGMVDLGASTPEMHGKPTKTVGAGADIHGIAQRVRDARAQAGVASPVPTGEGWNVQEAIDWGRQLKKEGADPEKSLSDFEKTGAISPDAAALIRAHGEDLAKVARNIEEKFGTDSEEYRVAQKASDSWEQRTKPIGTAWHKIGVAHQGETDLDTGSVSEMARAHKKATGNDFTAEQVKKATEIAEQSKKATQEAQDALRKAQDELSKAQVPKYRSYIINVAERIVARLDTAADAARARVKARLGRVSAGIDPEMLSDAAIIGASHIAHIGLDFAKWSDAMVKELGDTIKPHLQDIFAKSQKQVDDLADSMGGKEGATVKQAVRKTPAPKTPTERVFDAAKKEIEAGSQDMGDLRNKLAIDLGMTPREVAEHLAKNQTVKRATDEAYLKQARARQLKNSAKAWLKDQQSPVWQRYASKIPRALFGLKVAGHATVGIGTHAAQNLFIPSRWPAIARAYVDMWRFAYGKAATHEAAMEDLTRRPNFPVARRGGLVNDPYTSQGDYQSPEITRWTRTLRAGNLAFDALKELRQDLFDLHWNKLPAHMKTPEMAKAISDMMNHATGTTRRAVSESNWKNLFFFAPRLVGSRLAWEIADPVKAVYYGLKGKSATPAERHFALSQLKEKSAFLGVYLSALAVNQGILLATGSKQRVNMSDPSKADWLRFKGEGYQAAPFSGGIFAIRQFARLLHDLRGTRTPFEKLEGTRQSEAAGHLMQYARGELSPAAGYLADQISQQDFMGRNLPLSDEKDTKWMKEHGYGRYTWGQYATQALTPIPVEEPVMEIWKHWGMPDATASFWMKTLLEAGARATTGIYFGEDQSYGNK